MKIKTPSGETAVSDNEGRYSIKVTKKDKYLRTDIDYTSGTTVRISGANKNQPINLTVMLRRDDLRGWLSEDMKTYFPGAGDTWESAMSRFLTLIYANNKVYIRKFRNSSADSGVQIGGGTTDVEMTIGNQTPENIPACQYYELDGSRVESLNSIDIQTVHSITIEADGTEVSKYGAPAQFGAVIIKGKGIGKVNNVVAMTDWEAEKAKRMPGEEGMKAFIASQGKDITYSDGKVTIDGKVCELYIINDSEFNNMRGIEASWIDEIIILRSISSSAYGEKGKNGVVLISASQKEKKVIDEHGNTVTEKEAKKASRKKKK